MSDERRAAGRDLSPTARRLGRTSRKEKPMDPQKECERDGDHVLLQQNEDGRCAICGKQVEEPVREFDLQHGRVYLSDD